MENQIRFDIWRTQPGRALLARAWFPLSLQILVLAVMALFAINGWGIGTGESPARLLVLRKTSLTTLAVWGLWWPVMIALALAAGRIWCTVCPMELVGRIADGAARRLGYRRRHLPRWLRSGWGILAAYLVLQVSVAGMAIHRVPHYTSVVLIALGSLALFSGLLFREPRAFCKTLCPAGALFSVYGRHTPLQLDVRSPAVCASCSSKRCTSAEDRYRLDKRSCPSLLRPYSRHPSDGCVLCFQCAKVCPHENLGFGLVSPTAEIRRQRLLLPFEAVFVAVAAGFVTAEIAGEVKGLEHLFGLVPGLIHRLLPIVAPGWLEAIWALGIFPAALWTAVAGMAWLFGHRGGLKKAFLAAATGAAPVVAVAHLSKALIKLATWAGYLPLTLHDPRGLATLEHLSRKTLPTPSALIPQSLLGAVMVTAVLLVAWRSWTKTRVADAAVRPARRAGFVTATLLFGSILLVWTRT